MDRHPSAPHEWPSEGKAKQDPSRDRFRHNLRRIMAERGVTQASLARTMDVSRVAVHAWIWGTCFPETSRLIKLAQALGVQVSTLLESEPGSTAADSSNEEALLLTAFRRLPNTARLTLLADAYELTAQFAAKATHGEAREKAGPVAQSPAA